ncbi:MAG: hypothetical protein EHM79_11240 [Geobacter sp.]|nr:MAG: hypothetical protein EHM79_11240 [Geobacter sp.]
MVVSRHELDLLLAAGNIKAFRRSTGWVQVGKSPIRKGSMSYVGRERRNLGKKQTVARGVAR